MLGALAFSPAKRLNSNNAELRGATFNLKKKNQHLGKVSFESYGTQAPLLKVYSGSEKVNGNLIAYAPAICASHWSRVKRNSIRCRHNEWIKENSEHWEVRPKLKYSAEQILIRD